VKHFSKSLFHSIAFGEPGVEFLPADRLYVLSTSEHRQPLLVGEVVEAEVAPERVLLAQGEGP